MFTSPLQVALAVVEHEDQFLIGRRPEGVALAGYWEFPGGKVQPAETAEEAALRECREETGLEVTIVGEYPSHTQQYDHGTIHLRFFACRPRTPARPPRAPFFWAPRESLHQYQFPLGNRSLLDRLLARQPTERG